MVESTQFGLLPILTTPCAESYTDTYVDPDSGMVTTIQRKRPKASTATRQVDSTKAPESPKSDSQGKLSSNQPASRPATDLSARLAAVMSEKAGRPSSPSNSGRSTPKSATKDTILTSQAKPLSETNVEKDDDVSKSEKGEQPLVETEEEQATVDKQQDIPSGETEKEPEPTATENASKSAEENEPQSTVPEQTEYNTIPIAEEEETNKVEDTKPQPLLEPTNAALEDNAPNEHETSEVMEADKVGIDSTETAAAYEISGENPEYVEKQPSEDVDNRDAKAETIMEPAADNSEDATALVPDISTSVPNEDSTSSANEDEKWNAIIRQREEQVLSVMKSNAELHEQLHQLQDSSDAEISLLKSKIDELMSSKSGNKMVEDLRSQLAGKDTQIQGLMAEGEALSKRELKHMNALKKLRAEKQESEKSIQDLQKKIEKGSSDLIEANAKVARMTEAEKKNSGMYHVGLSALSDQFH
jgi:TATA element modulatory factor 1 DNA binding